MNTRLIRTTATASHVSLRGSEDAVEDGWWLMSDVSGLSGAAWDPATRSYSRSFLRAVHRRLSLFSWVMPRPKEPEGDSLQIAFRVVDVEAGWSLLRGLGLRNGSEVQRPSGGPFRGAAVQALVHKYPLDEFGHPRPNQPVAVVRLWNEEAIYDVTPALVALAEAIEQRLIETGVAALPRESRLLSWITRDRSPEYFDGD